MKKTFRRPSKEVVSQMFSLLGFELTDGQLEAFAADVSAVTTIANRLKEAEVGEAEPAFVLPADPELR